MRIIKEKVVTWAREHKKTNTHALTSVEEDLENLMIPYK
jgi:hypothetical protein